MLNAPESITCPECKQEFNTYFDDYDIDSASVNPKPGVWKLRTQCPHCDEEGRETAFEVEIRVQSDPKVTLCS